MLQDRQMSLPLFSDLVDNDVKARLAARLHGTERPPLEVVLPTPPDLSGRCLSDFVGPQTWYLFDLIEGGSDWLFLDPAMWNDNPQYIAMKEVVRGFPGVNDFSERGCRLAEDFKVIIMVHCQHYFGRFLPT